MTRRVHLHVGAPKSGTTYLQAVLDANRTLLADAGVLVVSRRPDVVHAAMVIREDPRLEQLGDRARGAWQRLVAQVRGWDGPDAVVSYELFAGATAEQAARALGDLAGLDVHVVITGRDYGRALPSAWQERLKFRSTAPLEQWQPPGEDAGPRAEWGWRTMDVAAVAERWGRGLPADHVHLVTVPRDGHPAELWQRFATACGLEVGGLDLEVPRANESLGSVEAELLRRVNEKLGRRLPRNRDQARWIRDTLAHRVLAPLGREPIGVTDEQFADAVRRSEDAIAALRARSYDVCGDLEDLRATRPPGATPGASSEAALLDAATSALAGLLLEMRAREASAGAGEAAPSPSLRSVARRALRRAGAPYVDHTAEDLRRRIAALEEQVQQGRRLHQRVAELDDVVAELLLPAAEQDAGVVARALTAYRESSL